MRIAELASMSLLVASITTRSTCGGGNEGGGLREGVSVGGGEGVGVGEGEGEGER